MARPMGPMTAKIENFIRMEARGEPRELILKEIFGLDKDSPQNLKDCATQKMHRWRYRPDAQAIWEDEMRARVRRCVPSAVGRLEKQVDNDNDWLANKAANDVINLAKTTGMFAAEEKAINVHVQGMPELGSPDQEEQDIQPDADSAED